MFASIQFMRLLSLTLALALAGTATAAAIPVDNTQTSLPEEVALYPQTSTQVLGSDGLNFTVYDPPVISTLNTLTHAKRFLLGLEERQGTVVRSASDKCTTASFTKIDHHRSAKKEDCIALERYYRGGSRYQFDLGPTIRGHWQRHVARDSCQFMARTSNIWGAVLGHLDMADLVAVSINEFSDGETTGAQGTVGCRTLVGDHWAKVEFAVGPA